jgi:hypothetical protein
MAAIAPKTSARGLELSEAAAPVLWGGLPPEEEAVGLVVPEAVLDKVGRETVELAPAEGRMVAEAAMEETRALKLATTEEAEALALEAAADAEDRAAEAEETTSDPPVRGN